MQYRSRICPVCISFLVFLHARIQSLKESQVVALESFSIELKETIVRKYSRKSVFEIFEELMLYFISITAWIENLYIKNYFYKDLKIKRPENIR